MVLLVAGREIFGQDTISPIYFIMILYAHAPSMRSYAAHILFDG